MELVIRSPREHANLVLLCVLNIGLGKMGCGRQLALGMEAAARARAGTGSRARRVRLSLGTVVGLRADEAAENDNTA